MGIDYPGIAERADLRALIVRELGEPDRSGKWRCPFHDDATPSMALIANGHRFKCYACGATGDALEWIVRRSGVGVKEAARLLDPSVGESDAPGKRRNRPAVASTSPDPKTEPSIPVEGKAGRKGRPGAWESAEWQAAASGMIDRAAGLLWSREGRPALDWLRGRGLTDRTIRAFRLGFLSDWTRSAPVESLELTDAGKPRGISAPRGIVIPWPAPIRPDDLVAEDEPPRWCGANVRRLNPDVRKPWVGGDKYQAFTGSSRGYSFPHPSLVAGVDALIVEGEMDALLAFQFLGHMVNAVTTGGTTSGPQPEALAELAGCPTWLLAFDADDAGDEAVEAWIRRGGERCRPLVLPLDAGGNDIGDVVAAGVDLAVWLASELRRLGLDEG